MILKVCLASTFTDSQHVAKFGDLAALNRIGTAFTEAPCCGYKQSGIGRELRRLGLDNYLETKQVTRLVRYQSWGWYLKG